MKAMDITLNLPLIIEYGNNEVQVIPIELNEDYIVYQGEFDKEELSFIQRFNHDGTTSWFSHQGTNDELAEDIGELIELKIWGECKIYRQGQ